MVIRRNGDLRALCHGCGFTCLQRVLKTFSGPSYLDIVDRIVSLQHFLANLILYEYVTKFLSLKKILTVYLKNFWSRMIGYWNLELYEKNLWQRKLKKLRKLTKSNEFLYFDWLGQFDRHDPFFCLSISF